MPHIIVEHTKDVAGIPQLLTALHQSLAGQETVVLESIKTRSIAVDYAIVGSQATESMVHITVKLLPGRPDDLLKKITGDLKAIAVKHCAPTTRITVESVDLYKPSYMS